MFDAARGWKSVSAMTLAAMLTQLPAGATVAANAVEDLSIFLDGQFAGYIDMATERIFWKERLDGGERWLSGS